MSDCIEMISRTYDRHHRHGDEQIAYDIPNEKDLVIESVRLSA